MSLLLDEAECDIFMKAVEGAALTDLNNAKDSVASCCRVNATLILTFSLLTFGLRSLILLLLVVHTVQYSTCYAIQSSTTTVLLSYR
mmetsp:Transcript_5057/g.5759  ORF Transcript_5057/g.5759 Transcript_5057/m.5759 type:complete len:87 (-) Transcript_5057:44-304(-)